MHAAVVTRSKDHRPAVPLARVETAWSDTASNQRMVITP
jgi:hypothetical protein